MSEQEFNDTEKVKASAEDVNETEKNNENQNGQVEASEDRVSQLEAELEEKEDKILRLQAEIANMNRRATIQRQDAAKYQSQKLASNLLTSLDNLDRALAVEVEGEEAQNLKSGVEMVQNSILDAFKQENIEVIDPLGEDFDPNFHQAVQTTPVSDDYADNTVAQVLQKGYVLNDRVLRPAMVIVAQN